MKLSKETRILEVSFLK